MVKVEAQTYLSVKGFPQKFQMISILKLPHIIFRLIFLKKARTKELIVFREKSSNTFFEKCVRP